MASTATRSSSVKILNNSFWYGLEQILEAVLFFGTSVAVARYLGPEKLGHFTYISFFVNVVNRTGATGLSTATRKYMSEFVATNRLGTARAVYRLTFKYQLFGSISLSLISVLAVLLLGDPTYKLMGVLLMLSIIPAALSWVPAMANLAFEDQSMNTISAFGYLVVYPAICFLSIHFHWDLAGIAAAMLIGRLVEMVLRIVPMEAKLRGLPREPMSNELRHRIHVFCLQGMAVQLLMSVVWDRSEMVFLQHYSSYEQIAFYSVSYGLVNNLLLAPRIFSGATNTTLMVECGRDPGRVDGLVRSAARYMLLVVFPIHLGAAAIAAQAIRVIYGTKYVGAIPVVVTAILLAIPRAFQEIPDTLLRAADRQKQLIWWIAITGVFNIVIDFLLIPRYGAVGAAWGNGLAQAVGVIAIWVQARRYYRFGLPASTIRLFFAALAMSAAAFEIARHLTGKLAFAVPIVAAIPIYVLLVKLLHGLDASDRVRLRPIGNRLPAPFRPAFDAALKFVTPAPSPNA